jgi:hypothetical protein
VIAARFRAFCEVFGWNLSESVHQFCSTHGNIKSILPFSAVLSFGKARSHTMKSGEQGGRGMTVILFLARTSHTKTQVSSCGE